MRVTNVTTDSLKFLITPASRIDFMMKLILLQLLPESTSRVDVMIILLGL